MLLTLKCEAMANAAAFELNVAALVLRCTQGPGAVNRGAGETVDMIAAVQRRGCAEGGRAEHDTEKRLRQTTRYSRTRFKSVT